MKEACGLLQIMRKQFFFMFICVASGALLNCMMALGCTVAAQTAGGPLTRPTEEVLKERTFRYNVLFAAPTGDAQLEGFGYFELKTSMDNHREHLSDPTAPERFDWSEIQAGWPFKSLQHIDVAPDYVPWNERFFKRPRAQPFVQSGKSDHLILPTTPIWPGFAYNSLIYAALIWLLPLPWTVRRLIRKRRSLCQKCGYPIGQNRICTECGRPVQSKMNDED